MSRVGDGARDWRELLCELASARGMPTSADLAAAFCKAAGKQSQREFEAVQRSISNWMSGANLPRRNNFALLGKTLEISCDADLQALWNRLYREASNRPVGSASYRARTAPARQGAPRPILGALRGPAFWRAAVATAMVAVIASTGVAGFLLYRSPSATAGQDDRTIGYLPFVQLRVGQSERVHAKRGRCGEAPPAWSEFEHELPILKTGRLVDDGLGLSRSDSCGGTTPGRLVRFVAERRGEEVFELFQRRIRVVVTD